MIATTVLIVDQGSMARKPPSVGIQKAPRFGGGERLLETGTSDTTMEVSAANSGEAADSAPGALDSVMANSATNSGEAAESAPGAKEVDSDIVMENSAPNSGQATDSDALGAQEKDANSAPNSGGEAELDEPPEPVKTKPAKRKKSQTP